jgi:amino acid permease
LETEGKRQSLIAESATPYRMPVTRLLKRLINALIDPQPYTVLPTFDDIDDTDVIGVVSGPRSQEEGASDSSALFHVVCVIAGTGILQLPYALGKSGWIGVAIMIMAAFVNEYTGRLIIQCLYYKGKRLTGYPEIGYLAFGRVGRGVVNVFFNSVLIGVTCLYLILAGMDLAHLTGQLNTKLWILVCSAVIWIPFIALRTLKEVAIVSLFGALASVGLVIIIFVLGIIDYPNHAGKVHYDIVRWESLATAIGTIAFSFGGNFVYPEVEHSMKNPQNFPRVLQKAMVIITVMYLMSSVVGYLTYGSGVSSPVLDNLPPGIVTTTGMIIVTIHVLLAIPVLLTTFSMDMERALGIDNPIDTPKQRFYRIVMRTITVIASALIACAIPFFADFMTLIGSVSNTMLVFVFPIIFHYKLFGTQNISVTEHIMRVGIIALGVLAGVMGGMEAVYNLYMDFKKNPVI